MANDDLDGNGAQNSICDLCARQGLRLTSRARGVAMLFDENAEPMDAEEILQRLKARDASLNRASIYRTLRRMIEKDVLIAYVHEGRRVFKKRPPAPVLRIVDIDSGDIALAGTDEISSRLVDFVRAAGFELHGAVELHVRPRG